MWNALHRLNRQWVFLLVALAVILPTVVMIPFPVPPSNSTRALYDRLEALDEGDFVALSFGYGPSSLAELQPQAEALLRHCFRKKLRVFMMSLWPDAPPLAEQALQKVATSGEFMSGGVSALQPGVDYVDCGYRTGGNVVILRMANDIAGYFDKDTRGESLAGMPVMNGVNTFNDVALVIDLAAGDSADWWVVFGNERYGVSLAAGVTGVMVSQMYPYLDSGQLQGLIGGGVGAAEYETLIGHKGAGVKRVAVLSFAHFLVIALVILGNALYLHERRAARE